MYHNVPAQHHTCAYTGSPAEVSKIQNVNLPYNVPYLIGETLNTSIQTKYRFWHWT